MSLSNSVLHSWRYDNIAYAKPKVKEPILYLDAMCRCLMQFDIHLTTSTPVHKTCVGTGDQVKWSTGI